jgi:chromosomal replication initiation ATPase DnaA
MSYSHTLENFYTHKGNEVAFLAAKKIVELPGEVFNPFYVYGAEGLGKTHLLNAIDNELNKKSATLFLSVKEFEKRIDENASFDSPLIVDDIHTIRDDYRSRLLDVVEQAVADNVQVCFSANVAPQDISDFSPTLCSLIESGLICDLQPALQKDRVELIKKKAEDAGIILPDDLVETLAQVGSGSLTTIVNMINRLITFSSLGNLPSDIDTIKSMLEEFYPKKKVCPIPSVLGMLKSDDIWELVGTASGDLRGEYEKKIYAWELKGFNVSLLKDQKSRDETQLKQAYEDFVGRVRKLIELQRIFHDDLHEGDRLEVMRIESLLFDPRKVGEIERLLASSDKDDRNAKTYRKFSEFLFGACNREAWNTYHDEVLENLGTHNPCFVFGAKGTGKTFFLEAICDDLLSREKAVAFCNLANRDATLNVDDMERNDVLVLDDFHSIVEEESRMNNIMAVVEMCMQSNKQVFIGSVSWEEDLPDRIKSIMDKGLRLELGKPSSDVVVEYLHKHLPNEAAEIIERGLPEFVSFYDIDYYIQSSDQPEHSVVPLGLPGEDSPVGKEEPVVEVEAVSVDGVGVQLVLARGSVNIEDESKYVMPEGSAELIEEKF